MGDPVPARDDEQVAGTPLKGLIANARPSLTLNRRENAGVGGSIARSLESLRQQLDEGADGRHREIAGLRVRELKLQPMAGVPFAARFRSLQRLARVAIG